MQRLITEFIGSFFLVLVIALTHGNPLAIGVVLVALVYAGGHVSGGHYNPAVSIAVWMRGQLSVPMMIKYWGAQIAGAFVATIIVQLITETSFLAVSAVPDSFLPVFLVELLFTAALAYTVLSVATVNKVTGNSYFGMAIGGVLMAGVFAGGPISGAVYNPAVLLGSALFQLNESIILHPTLLGYLLSQVVGGLLAGWVVNHVNGKT